MVNRSGALSINECCYKLRIIQFSLGPMSQEAQLGEAGIKLDDSSGVESILESKNNLIKSLRYDLGKITKV